MMLIARTRVDSDDVNNDSDVTHVNYTGSYQWQRKLLKVLEGFTDMISIVKLNSHGVATI